MNEIALTPRQAQVLQLLWQGKTNREIGALLGISRRTVEVHRVYLRQRLGAKNAAHLIHLAVTMGLVRA